MCEVSRVVFQMLHQIVPGNFRKDEVMARVEKYVKPLPEQVGYDGDLEVVPFEGLWGMVLENLD